MSKKTTAPPVTAHDVMRALRAKHADDVFIPECKDGPSQLADGFLRMDAWVLKRSWAHPLTIGYEVKVSRSDFMRDEKWPGYLPLCNEFWFVAPKGLIQPAELPQEAGLLELIGGGRLIAKKRAPYRDVPLPDSLWRYIVMCRCKIERTDRSDASTYWADWLARRQEKQSIGHVASKRIAERARQLERENEDLRRQHQAYDDVRAALLRLGLDPDSRYLSAWSVEQRLREAKKVLPDGLMAAVSENLNRLQLFQERLRELEAAGRDMETEVGP